MANTPVTVIIPSYNRAHCIEKAIRSALAQTVSDAEILIADDGSTDDTEGVVSGLGSPRVRYVRQQNAGCSSARNFGVSHARSRYVAFLDSDDEWDPQWLAVALAALESEPAVGAVYASLERVDADGHTTGVFDVSVGGRYREASVSYVLQQCAGLLGSNVVARRDLVVGIGGWDETFPTSGDLDFGLRLATASRVALVASPMVRLIETGGSLSKKVNSGNRLRVLDKFERGHPALAQQHARIIRHSRAAILCSYGEDLLWVGRIAEAERQLVASLRLLPSRRATWLLLKTQAFKLRGRATGHQP